MKSILSIVKSSLLKLWDKVLSFVVEVIKLRIPFFLYNRKVFWIVRRWFQKWVSFNFWKTLFSLRFKSTEGKKHLVLLAGSIISVLIYISYAILFIAIMQYLPRLFVLPFSVSKNALRDLFSAIASITGIFLALYFTSLSVVAGNLFTKVTDDIRSLFVREKVGYQYIWILTLTMVVSVFYIALGTMKKVEPSNYSVIVVSLMAAYGIIRFMHLGFRAFNFFDPTKLSSIASEDIETLINAATSKGFRWKNKHFQYHYQNQTDNNLITLKRLIHFASDQLELFKSQLFQMSANICNLIKLYENEKNKIPTSSLWFKDRASFQDWMLADSSALIVALNSGTTIQPKIERDTHWFERKAIAISFIPLDLFIKNSGSISLIQSTIENYVGITSDISRNLDKKFAEILLEELGKSILKLYEKDKEETSLISVTDSSTRIPIGLIIGLDDSLNIETFKNNLSKINWKSPNWPYNSNLPSTVVKNSENLSASLQFEKSIEGSLVCPVWYLENLHVRNYLIAVKEYFEYLFALSDSFFRKQTNYFIEEKKYICAAQTIQRWQEYLNKLEKRTFDAEKFFKYCEKYKLVKDLPWVEIDFKEVKERIAATQREAVVIMAELLLELEKIESENIPDYFGQAYTFAIQEAYDACFRNDNETFEKIFRNVFFAALLSQQKISKKTENWNADSRLLFSVDPLVDIMELSGYAKIYSELYENPKIWDACKLVWDNYLENEKGEERIAFIVSIIRYKKTQFNMMPKDILRSNWEINFLRKLREKDLVVEPYYSYGERKKVSHNSWLIRKIASHGMFMIVKSADIFISLYFKKHPKSNGVDLSFASDFVEE